MGSLISSDISLDFRFLLEEMGSSIDRIVSEVLRNQSPSERIAHLADYIDGLEAEKKKIEAFKHGDESTMVPELSHANNPMEEINSSAFSSKSSCSRSGYNFSTDNHSKSTGEEQSQQLARKQRRCWSPELHRRFVDALQQLGGAQAATPKQVRELMRVDGLSNDEVKSHLQKYRIHTRRVGALANTNHPIVLGASWILSQEQCFESSNQRNSWPGSPQRHTHLAGFSRRTTLTGGESMEDEDDEKSVSHSWRNEIQLSLGDNDDVKMGRLWL